MNKKSTKERIDYLIKGYEEEYTYTKLEVISKLIDLTYEADIDFIIESLDGEYKDKFSKELIRLNDLSIDPEEYFRVSSSHAPDNTPDVVRNIRRWWKEKENKNL